MMKKKLNESFEKAAVTEMRIFSLSLSLCSRRLSRKRWPPCVRVFWLGWKLCLSLTLFFLCIFKWDGSFCLFVFLPSWRERERVDPKRAPPPLIVALSLYTVVQHTYTKQGIKHILIAPWRESLGGAAAAALILLLSAFKNDDESAQSK